ncbi:GntR family transcriptional regulator [Shinella daejeonensis]|uniref:GntR family transcriptional regulator n=1 Tax=Shinella daejeonensis TaxID=659017 RepID=UPI0020C800EA|nr:GntR family transcriptional regulator [Shinella daejeonensis]MCP8896515.1 GntR family transcriptional regulator [Shinella daejeonensis]
MKNESNLREQVSRHVRAEIVAGYAQPGAMYSVPSLAENFGISTTPVREALLELAREGFLEPHRNRGFRVTMPSVAETRNLFEMREVLEVHAARMVAAMPRRDLSALLPLADDVTAAARNHSYRAFLATDREFHRALLDMAGNPILTQTVMTLRGRIRYFGDASAEGVERQRASAREHYQIIDLVTAGDLDGISDLMRDHVRAWEPLFMKAVAQFEQPRSLQPAPAATSATAASDAS